MATSESGDAAGHRQQHAFDRAPASTICRRVAPTARRTRRLRAPRDGAREQQVGDVGAGDEQHEPADGKQDLQAAPVLFLHHGDAGPGGNDVDDLLAAACG